MPCGPERGLSPSHARCAQPPSSTPAPGRGLRPHLAREHVERLAAHAFYAEPSAYVFYDAEGAAHEIAQGEGGEQGDPLMPALYALGQHPALLQAHAALSPGEDLYAYLDDIYVTCQPKRAGPAFTALGTALWERANIRVHLGKTRAWNAAGEEPSALLDALPAAARADAWAGSWARPPAQQGITVLGTPLGHAARALLLSQAGPGGSLALTALPTREEFTLQDDTFRCVLLRRLRLPLPLEARGRARRPQGSLPHSRCAGPPRLPPGARCGAHLPGGGGSGRDQRLPPRLEPRAAIDRRAGSRSSRMDSRPLEACR